MRQGLILLGLVSAVVAAVVFVSPGGASSSPEEQRALLHVARVGRQAVLLDRPRAVCNRLTARARLYSRLRFDYLEHRRSSRRPGPNTCVRAVGFMIDSERRDGYFKPVLRRPSLARFRVVRIRGNRAHLRLGDYADIYFLKGRAGWRGDYATFSPFDGSSGR